MQSGQWKLVVETRYRATLNSFEHSSYYGPDGLLFDLRNDPGETYSFTREYPEIVQQMRTPAKRPRGTEACGVASDVEPPVAVALRAARI